MAHSFNSITWKMKTRIRKIKSSKFFFSNFETSLSYLKLCLKKFIILIYYVKYTVTVTLNF